MYDVLSWHHVENGEPILVARVPTFAEAERIGFVAAINTARTVEIKETNR